MDVQVQDHLPGPLVLEWLKADCNILLIYISLFVQQEFWLTLICFGSRLPILSRDDRQAYLSLFIDIRVVNFSLEANFWGFERIFGRESDFNPKSSFVVWCIILKNKWNCVAMSYFEFHHFNLLDLLFFPARSSSGEIETTCSFILTGHTKPDQIRIFRSSTSISLNDFRPEALISASS